MLYVTAAFVLIYCSLNLWLCRCDIKAGLLPDRFTCPLLWAGLLFWVLQKPEQLSSAVLGAIFGYAGFALLYWVYRVIRRREGLGYGDVKYLAALGAWHGWESLPLLVAMASGLSLAFILLQIIGERTLRALKNPLPFGPFLAAAGFVTGWANWISLPL